MMTLDACCMLERRLDTRVRSPLELSDLGGTRICTSFVKLGGNISREAGMRPEGSVDMVISDETKSPAKSSNSREKLGVSYGKNPLRASSSLFGRALGSWLCSIAVAAPLRNGRPNVHRRSFFAHLEHGWPKSHFVLATLQHVQDFGRPLR